MAWKHNGRVITVGKAWVSDDNIKYPRQWNNLTDAEKKSAGLVWEDDPVVETFDNRFYWAKDKERSLADVLVVDPDGSKMVDRDGNQLVEKGLKSIWIEKTKTQTNYLLSFSDWQVTRKAEKGTALASATATYRDAVRTACDTIETKINNCSDLAAFKTLFVEPTDSDGKVTGNPPIVDFPDGI